MKFVALSSLHVEMYGLITTSERMIIVDTSTLICYLYTFI